MKRELKKGDVLYLGEIAVTVMGDNITQAQWDEAEYNVENYGIGLQDENGNFPWIPHTMEQLLSYTPYTIKDGKLDGFSYEKPWQPQHGEPVWVRDAEIDNWESRVFKEMEGAMYKVYSYMLENGDRTIESTWNYCKPFNPSEIANEQETKMQTPLLELQQGDLVVVWDNDNPSMRHLRVFHSAKDANSSCVYASMHTNKNDKFYSPAYWDNYTPYIPLYGVIPVMVQFRDNGDKIIMLKVDNQSAINGCSEVQNINARNYFHTGKDCFAYELYDKNNFKFNIEFNEEKVKEPAQPIKPLQLRKGDLVVVWDDDYSSRYIRSFYSLNSDGSIKTYKSVKVNDTSQRTQDWANYEPYAPLKGVTPVIVTYETEGQMDDEEFIRLLVENSSDVEVFAKQQNLVRSSYVYKGQSKIDYKLFW